MESLARLFLAMTSLFEAEGLAVKRQVVCLAVAAGLGLIHLGLVFAGLGFLLFSLFRCSLRRSRPLGATLAMGVLAMLLAWAAPMHVRRLLR